MRPSRTGALLSVVLAALFAAGVAEAGSVRKGEALFNSADLGTNGKKCSTCHRKGRGIDGSKKTFKIIGRKMNSLEEAVNFCVTFALRGEPLEKDSREMKDIISYIKTLKKKKRRRIIGC